MRAILAVCQGRCAEWIEIRPIASLIITIGRSLYTSLLPQEAHHGVPVGSIGIATSNLLASICHWV
jgi:hypothetical protein